CCPVSRSSRPPARTASTRNLPTTPCSRWMSIGHIRPRSRRDIAPGTCSRTPRHCSTSKARRSCCRESPPPCLPTPSARGWRRRRVPSGAEGGGVSLASECSDEPDAMIKYAKRAIALLDPERDAETLGEELGELSWKYWAAGRLDAALETSTAALELLRPEPTL